MVEKITSKLNLYLILGLYKMEKIEKKIEECKCIVTNIRDKSNKLIFDVKRLYDNKLSLDTLSNLIYMEDGAPNHSRIELFASNGRRLNGLLKNGTLPNYIEDFITIYYINSNFCISYCCKREGGNEQYMYYENMDLTCVFNVIYILLSFNIISVD
ncbi:Hypothetical protein ORPV_76 [Orpheovirus IHUMI-LCC2]|uniref:Uncharacterized protein n=1 Tax=Orpheovirus IHUMI-LCC2 TaxID=2023057 RepID=A0A2I2L393_9VIRU|nr:Hypothetical protein ORPV_76 [Orpheovirus IHUMI-LCC2]SNW61980.1 Hypothetical protein ORPV_76 [Orpheovirus IHUMI-LCC2]